MNLSQSTYDDHSSFSFSTLINIPILSLTHTHQEVLCYNVTSLVQVLSRHDWYLRPWYSLCCCKPELFYTTNSIHLTSYVIDYVVGASHYVYGSIYSLYTGFSRISATHIHWGIVNTNPDAVHSWNFILVKGGLHFRENPFCCWQWWQAHIQKLSVHHIIPLSVLMIRTVRGFIFSTPLSLEPSLAIE